ncbi:MAG: M1 family metallopeptidase [Nanoarchaeota archaeon]
MSKKEIARLQDFVNPSHYTISIEPSKDMNSYKGSVQIKANISKPTKEIILHSKNSIIKTTTICVGTQCLLPKIKEDKDSETITLEVQKEIKGDIEIHIEFDGLITEDLAGIYKSKYEHKGKTEHIITTQCEAPYARRIFPCFDEPAKKATFDIIAIIEKNLKAISNTLPKSEKIENNKKTVTFKTSPKMSSYLFYLGIGDFEFLEDNYKSVKIRIVTTPGKTNNASFAINKTKKYLEYFEKYSEVPYPLEKLDLIAVPDFNVGGMENWGAIAFREVILLIDLEKSSTARKKLSAEVISHELWHQWSGDLVTMKWWEDLWLNESFANYMAFKAVHNYNPEWNVWDDYLSGALALGLFKDSLKTTHPIKVEVKNPDEIGEIFDEISYEKGGSILRMLENFIGEEQFRKGVSNYLKKYSYSNASASDFWDCLKEVSHNKKVKEMMESWISEPGYPLVSVEKSKAGVKISQKRFNKNSSQLWPVPISIYEEGKESKILLDKKEENHPFNLPKLNHKHFGFYRTKYSEEILNNLSKLVKEKKLPKEDRWGIHNDLWALCNFSEVDLKIYLNLLDNYLEEDNYITLAEVSSAIRKIDRLFYYESWWPKSRKKILDKLLPTYKKQLNKLGWKNKQSDSSDDRLMRSLCISFCGYAYDKETIEQAKKIYASEDIELDIANPIYFIVARDGDEKLFKDMISKYESSKELESKVKLLGGLGCFFDPKLLSKTLDYAISDKVRSQDLLYVLRNLMINPAAQRILLDWAKKNWSKFDKHQDNHYIMRDFVDPLVICQVTTSAKEGVKELLEKNKFRYEMIKANALEILDLNLKFIEKNREFLKNY